MHQLNETVNTPDAADAAGARPPGVQDATAGLKVKEDAPGLSPAGFTDCCCLSMSSQLSAMMLSSVCQLAVLGERCVREVTSGYKMLSAYVHEGFDPQREPTQSLQSLRLIPPSSRPKGVFRVYKTPGAKPE